MTYAVFMTSKGLKDPVGQHRACLDFIAKTAALPSKVSARSPGACMCMRMHLSVCACCMQQPLGLMFQGTAPRSPLGASKVMEVEDRLAFLELMPFWWAWEQKSGVRRFRVHHILAQTPLSRTLSGGGTGSVWPLTRGQLHPADPGTSCLPQAMLLEPPGGEQVTCSSPAGNPLPGHHPSSY